MKLRRVTVRMNGGLLKPVSQITDRAKRYRANRPEVRPSDPKQCGFCGSGRNVVPDHINGDESDGDADNLMWLCKSCNTRKGLAMKRAGLGRRTRQFNPAKRNPSKASRASQMKEYGAAIKVMRGEWEGDIGKAVDTIRSTPRSVRSAFTARSWPVRKQRYGPSGRQMSFGDVPF